MKWWNWMKHAALEKPLSHSHFLCPQNKWRHRFFFPSGHIFCNVNYLSQEQHSLLQQFITIKLSYRQHNKWCLTCKFKELLIGCDLLAAQQWFCNKCNITQLMMMCDFFFFVKLMKFSSGWVSCFLLNWCHNLNVLPCCTFTLNRCVENFLHFLGDSQIQRKISAILYNTSGLIMWVTDYNYCLTL